MPFFQKTFSGIPSVSNSFDPDQARCVVVPDLRPNCLPRLSADDTRKQRVKTILFVNRALSDLSVFTSTNRVRSSQSASGFATMFSRSPPTQKADPVSISMFYMPKVRTHLILTAPIATKVVCWNG